MVGSTLVSALLVLLVVLGVGHSIWRARRQRRARAERAEADRPRCAGCGYDLSGLEFPRCPECGALRGFTVPLEELGLTDEEVRAGFKRQREIRQTPGESSGPTPPP